LEKGKWWLQTEKISERTVIVWGEGAALVLTRYSKKKGKIGRYPEMKMNSNREEIPGREKSCPLFSKDWKLKKSAVNEGKGIEEN